MLGQDAPDVRYRVTAPEAGWFRRLLMPLADPQSWLDMLHSLVGFITATGVGAGHRLVVGRAGRAGVRALGLGDPEGPDSKDLPELLARGAGRATRESCSTW